MLNKILHITIAKIIIGSIGILAAYWIPRVWLNHLLRPYKEIQILRLIAIPIIAIVLVLVVYTLFSRYYEKRKITEFATNNIGKYLGFGLLLGFLIPALSILVSYLRAEYIVLSINDFTTAFFRDFIISICMGMSIAVFEEVLFRGVLFRLIEERLGSYIAIVISGLLFGLIHLLNDHGAYFAAISISVVSIVLSAAYMYTRNLWFPIIIHFTLNFTQGNIFGTAVSGNTFKPAFLISQLEGSTCFTGGSWGIEATVQMLVLSLITGVILLVMCHKKGEIRQKAKKNNPIHHS